MSNNSENNKKTDWGGMLKIGSTILAVLAAILGGRK